MVNKASEADYALLVQKSQEFNDAYPITREWRRSPFNWLLTLAPGTRGAIARRMVEEWVAALGLSAHQMTDHRQRYVVVEGKRIQVKFSTLWNNGEYRFQQIRDQDYDYVLCLGISPDDVHTWLIPKDEMLEHLRGRAGQHTGAGAHETYWISVAPAGGEPWLADYGNQLSDVRELLLSLGR